METLRTGTEWFQVDNGSVSGSVRREAIRLADKLGFSEGRAGEAGIVASEIASNIWRHAAVGSVGVQIALRSGTAGVRIIGIDNGPGMSDIPLSSTDGHSTSGTLGVGLGAIARLSSSFDVSSHPGKGTVLVADLWPDQELPGDVLDVGGVTRPIAGEQTCGDAVAAREIDGHQLLMLSDGLGHGPLAAASSIEALAAFHETTSVDPIAILTEMHRRLDHTRGAAIAVMSIDPSFTTSSFAGVGNVSAFVVDGVRRQVAISYPGIVGHRALKLRRVDLELPVGALVVLHSDGVRENWNLRDTPGLARRASIVIAAALLRDAGNRPDDASVLVARRRG